MLMATLGDLPRSYPQGLRFQAERCARSKLAVAQVASIIGRLEQV